MTSPEVPQHPLDRIAHAYYRRRFASLFYSLLFTLVAAPLLLAVVHRDPLLELLLATNLLIGVLGFRRGRTLALVVIALAAALRLAPAWLETPSLSTHALAIWSALALLTAAGAVRFTLRAGQIDSERVYAALSAYLLAGFCFGVLYWILESVVAGSLMWGVQGIEAPITLSNSIYFSFVTLATLGYGDIVPALPIARGLAMLEAISGQLYIAVMIASLVGSYAQRSER